jgi:hypothetical protein
MRCLVVYYSRSGVNKDIAMDLHKELSCEVEEIRETVNRSGAFGYIVSGMQATMRKSTEIGQLERSPLDYDITIIVAPLWVGVVPPPVRTYVNINRGKFRQVALVSVSGAGEGNRNSVSDLESLLEKRLIDSLLLSVKEVKSGAYRKKLDAFADKIKKKKT